MTDDLMLAYHRRTDHGRDGAKLDARVCNCRELFDAYRAELLKAVKHPARAPHENCMIAQGKPDPVLQRCRYCRLFVPACDSRKQLNDGQPCCEDCSH